MKKAIIKDAVLKRFGDVRYSCEGIDSKEDDCNLFHVIKSDNWTAYISEYPDEFLCTVYRKDKVINPAIETETVEDLFNAIEILINE
jgi:hypothetical protein